MEGETKTSTPVEMTEEQAKAEAAAQLDEYADESRRSSTEAGGITTPATSHRFVAYDTSIHCSIHLQSLKHMHEACLLG